MSMDKTQCVSLTVACSLNVVGYNGEHHNNYYNRLGALVKNAPIYLPETDGPAAPTYEDVEKWLSDKGVCISVTPVGVNCYKGVVCDRMCRNCDVVGFIHTEQEAWNKTILKGLERL